MVNIENKKRIIHPYGNGLIVETESNIIIPKTVLPPDLMLKYFGDESWPDELVVDEDNVEKYEEILHTTGLDYKIKPKPNANKREFIGFRMYESIGLCLVKPAIFRPKIRTYKVTG